MRSQALSGAAVCLMLMGLPGCRNTLPEACHAEPDSGRCRAAHTRFRFDEAESACKPFIWGGCGGTVPFDSRAACEQACLRDRQESVTGE